MINEMNNIFGNKKHAKTRNLIPHNSSKLNNYKSNRYFTVEEDTNLMKEALTKYRENQQKSEKNDSISKSLNSNMSTADITYKYKLKQKFSKNNTIKFDKNILEFAEPRTKIEEFHKINPKVIESVTIENLDNFFDKENIKENGNKNIIYKKSRINDYNKYIKLQKKNKKFDFTIDMNNDIDEETIINENDDEDSETFFDGSECPNFQTKHNKKSIYDNRQDENQYINLNINDINVNFEHLLMIEKLFSDLMKDLEVNKMELYKNKLSIIKDFLYIFNDLDGFKITNIIDSLKIKSDNNIFLSIKEYLIEQLVFFYSIILIDLIKKDKSYFFSGLHSLSFYFHQNFIIFLYIIISNTSKDPNNSNSYYDCLKILNENKTWFDKTNIKDFLIINNKICKKTLINLLQQIKEYFKNNIEYNYIENVINLFLSQITINTLSTQKISELIKEYKTFPSINYLLEKTNFNNIPTDYTNTNNKILYEFPTEENIDNDNNENVEFKIEENITTLREQNSELIPKEPYLPPINPKYKYTLILDLDETLVHYISDNDSAYIQIRPGTEDFLIELSIYYELVIFTAALQKYADLVINSIDPNGVVKYRLYRQHTISIGNSNIKDLNKLGRDLRSVIIVDNCVENFGLQKRNGLKIIDFEGNEFDDELEYLKEDLIKLARIKPMDVRDYLEGIQSGMDKRAIFFENLNVNNNDIVNYKDNDNDNLFKETIKENLINNNNNQDLDNNSHKEFLRNRYSYNNDSYDV